MQDFPALFRHLSLVTHLPWIVVAVAAIVVLFALAVAIKLWDKLAERAADLAGRFFGKLLTLVSRIFRVTSPSRELVLTPAQRLARAICGELDRERKNLKLKASLPVSWKPAPGNSPVLSDAADDLDIVGAYTEIWPVPLVILGGAGSGKSVLAQSLALGILGNEPEKKDYPKPDDMDRPRLSEQIPVIFGLHSWEPGTKLDEWLTSQLTGLYYVPQLTKDLAGELVSSRQVLPILDGFDEITPAQRDEFLELLNNESDRPLILTSRPGEYWDSGSGAGEDSNRTILADAEVIELTALPLDEVGAYLRRLPRKRKPAARTSSSPRQPLLPAWEPVAAALLGETPPKKGTIKTIASLRGALSTPLMVAIARDIYRHENPAELLKHKFRTSRDAEKYLLDSFVPAIYAGVSGDRTSWTPDQMKQVEKAERPFRYLAAHLQSPQGKRPKGIAWWELGTGKNPAVKRALLCGLAAGLVMMVANGITTSLAVLGVGGLGVTPVQGVVLVLGNSMAIAVAFGLMHCLAAWHAGGVIQPSWVGLSIPWLRGNRTVGRHLAREFGFGFAGGSVGGGAAILGLLLSSLLVNAIGGAPSGASATTASPGWPATLLAALGMTMIFGVTAGNVAALQAPVEIESAGGPLELLATDRRLALGGGAVAGVMSGAAIGCLIGLEQGPLVGLGFAAVGCATVWLGGAISVTAWGQWLICGRLLLPLSGQLPWRTRAFLRDAHKRGVLRQSGAFYQFRHTLLQELYAPAKDAPPEQKASLAWLCRGSWPLWLS